MSQEPILSPGSVPRISYAPNNEDILLDRIFGDHVGTFMDVGASRPCRDNLTYFFYRRGWRGVNLEPVPRLYRELQATRPGDMNLPLAAWDANGEVPFFEIANAGGDGLSTFSARLAEQYRAAGAALIERRVAVRTIRSLVEELQIDPPDFLDDQRRGIGGAGDPGHFPGALAAGRLRRRRELAAHGHPVAPGMGAGPARARLSPGRVQWSQPVLSPRRPARQASRLELPVSVLDRFQRAEVVALEQQVRDLEQQSIRWQSDAAHWRDLCAELDRRHADDVGALRGGPAAQELEARLTLAEQNCTVWERDSASLRRDPGRDPADAPPLPPDRPARRGHDRLPLGPPAQAESGVLKRQGCSPR